MARKDYQSNINKHKADLSALGTSGNSLSLVVSPSDSNFSRDSGKRLWFAN